MKFKIKKIAHIAEIFGGVAVLISLLFVGVQLKESTKATRSSTAAATISNISDWYVTMGTDEESSASFWRFLADPESMTKEERLQHIYVVHGLILTFQNSYFLAQEGTLDIRIHESINQALIGVKDQPGFILFWESRKSIFFQEYQEYVDAILQSDENVSEGVYNKPND